MPAICIEIPEIPSMPCQPVLPGNAPIPALTDLDNQFESAMAALGQLNTAMAPLQPFFDILNAVLGVFDVLKAVASLNPIEIVSAITDIAGNIAKLGTYLPQYSLIKTIKGFVCLLYQLLAGLVEELESIRDQLEKIDEALTLANTLGDNRLKEFVDCAVLISERRVELLNAHMGQLSSMFELYNNLAGLVGAPEIDIDLAMDTSAGIDTSAIDAIIETLGTTAKVLEVVLNAIPGG